MIVGEDPNGATEIATRLGAEISPVSRLVGRVARRGLVRTGKVDRDRRVTRVTVTDEASPALATLAHADKGEGGLS